MENIVQIELSDQAKEDLREMFQQEIEPLKRALSSKKISTKETMKILGIKSYNTLKGLMRSGDLPCYPDKQGGRPKFLNKFSKNPTKFALTDKNRAGIARRACGDVNIS